MRISGNGKKQISKSENDKVSLSSIEDKIQKGHNNIANKKFTSTNKSSLENEKLPLKKESNSLEIKKEDLKNKKDISEKESKEITNRKDNNIISKKSKNINVVKLNRLSKKRISCMAVTGVLSSIFLGGLVYGTYYNCIRYPKQMKQDIEISGLGGINRWINAISSLSNSEIKKETGVDSYLSKELEYANDDTNRIEFFKKIVSTVNYKPKQVEAKNIYGNTMISREDNSIVFTDSLVNDSSEEVTLSYIDYSKVPLNEEEIKKLVKDNNLKVGLGDYSNSLVDIFCEYINFLSLEEIPLVSVNHIPNLVKKGSFYNMSCDEDIFLDKVLFSSDDFYDLLVRFSEIAAKGSENPDWAIWNNLPEKDKKDTPEPNKVLENLEPTSAWQEWNSLNDKDKKNSKEPVKYDTNKVMSNSWCGAYYLLEEHKVNGNVTPIKADVGDGTIEKPASLFTGVNTSIFISDNSGNKVAKPIKVKLIDYRISQDALDYFETKDTRNRGYDVKSEVQYISYVFEITNLSDEELTIYDNSSLADELANLSPRTGTVFGLKSSVTLKPYETGTIESWGCSTELNKKYLIWGGDFNRELPVVWFRVLAGDIDNPDENKGVTINIREDEEDISTSTISR